MSTAKAPAKAKKERAPLERAAIVRIINNIDDDVQPIDEHDDTDKRLETERTMGFALGQLDAALRRVKRDLKRAVSYDEDADYDGREREDDEDDGAGA